MTIRSKETVWLFGTIALLLGATFASLFGVIHRFGSVPNTVRYLNGQSVFVRSGTPLALDRGAMVQSRVRIYNAGFRRVRILGFGSSCMARPLNEMPFLIEPGTAYELIVEANSSRRANQSEPLLASIYTDLPNQTTIPFVLSK